MTETEQKELDARVAREVMGWETGEIPPDGWYYLERRPVGDPDDCPPSAKLSPIPPFSSDWNAAELVLAQIPAGKRVKFGEILSGKLLDYPYSLREEAVEGVLNFVYAPNKPELICRAALEVVTGAHDGK